MIRATIRRDVHNPHARSGGSTALICRRVRPLSAAAPRDRRDPLTGIGSVVTAGVQQRLVTFVNVTIQVDPSQLARESNGAVSAPGRPAS
ncbi:hypothetical protein TUM20984_37890 [Mycobacterium antarcticum]|nr:hypothetical protein TUM20984_37890 [Mycolicibacterium sp. TUM20984]